MLKIIFIISLISLTAKSQNTRIEESLNTLSNAQKYVGSMTTEVSDPNCTECSNEERLNRCVNDVCSKSKINHNYEELRELSKKETLENLDNPSLKNTYNEIYNLVKDTMISEVEDSLSDYSELKKNIEQKNIPKDPSMLSLVITFQLLSESDELPTYIKELNQKIKDKYENFLISNFDSHVLTPQVYYGRTYPDLSIKDAIQREFEKFNALKESLNNSEFGKGPSIRDALETFAKGDLYRRYINGEDITVEETKMLLSLNQVLPLLVKFFEQPYIKKIRDSIDINRALGELQSPKALEQVTKITNRLNQYKSNPELLEPFISDCANNIIAAHSFLPSDTIKKSLPNIVKDIKSKVERNFLSKLSTETRKNIALEMSKWEFITQSKEEFIKFTKNDLKESILFNSNIKEKKAKRSQEEKKIDNFIDTDIFSYKDSGEKHAEFMIDEVFGMEETCDFSEHVSLSDAAFTMYGAIIVSPISLKNIDAGKAIIAHELGHKIQHALRGNNTSSHSFQKNVAIKSCLFDKHNSAQYIEEDYADLISALAEGETGNNMACIFPHKLSKTLQEKDSSHSNYLFRLLHIETVQRGSIPASCQTFLKKSHINKNYNSCIDAEYKPTNNQRF